SRRRTAAQRSASLASVGVAVPWLVAIATILALRFCLGAPGGSPELIVANAVPRSTPHLALESKEWLALTTRGVPRIMVPLWPMDWRHFPHVQHRRLHLAQSPARRAVSGDWGGAPRRKL